MFFMKLRSERKLVSFGSPRHSASAGVIDDQFTRGTPPGESSMGGAVTAAPLSRLQSLPEFTPSFKQTHFTNSSSFDPTDVARPISGFVLHNAQH